MLLEITVNNIALIEHVKVEFAPGFNVLTGETGAGKSILIDALNFVLGSKADRDLLRTGTTRAQVEALFDIAKVPQAQTVLDEMHVENEDGYILLSREMGESGRTVSRVNGCVVPVSLVKKLTGTLVDLHGQHEHQGLMQPEKHLGFVDSYGDETHVALLKETVNLYAAYQSICRDIERRNLDVSERERMQDILTFQLDEIDAVKPKNGEYEKLEAKDKLFQNAEQLSHSLSSAYKAVYAGSGKSSSAQELLRKAADAMAKISDVDERFEKMRARLEELFYSVQDIGYELQDANDSFEFDPEEAQRVSDRLDSLKKLMRKYGPELSDVIAFRENAKKRLAEIETSDEALAELENQRKKLEKQLKETCIRLTQSRKAIAEEFSKRLLHELSELGMGRTRFEVRFSQKKEFSATGNDDVEFMLSPNPGEAMKPLSAIASGGELSRIMLAIKAVSADNEGVGSMIFDEIDTGVSGRMAQVVGEKMASIANKRQVICITHLPQIACLADAQYRIEKTVQDGRTGSNVQRLDTEGRVQEIARLVGGAGDQESSKAHARNMLSAAQALRKEQS